MPYLTRRRFIERTAATAGAFALPRFSIAQAGAPASRKLNIAFIGGGGIAKAAFGGCQGENYVAICDVDDNRAAAAFKEYPNARRFRDFRRMLDEMGREIDAVVVSTPDHIHFPAAIDAMRRGKAVYVQKPLTHDIWQARTLVRAAHRYKVVTQMGNQGHAGIGIRLVKEWFEAGVIGEVREVHAWFNGPNMNGPYFKTPDAYPPSPSPVPSGFDWDLWQGPVPPRPFSSNYHPLTWRGWWDYGCGELGDWACHTLDAPFWALQLGSPHAVDVEEIDMMGPGYCPRASVLAFHFPARGKLPPVTLRWYDGGKKPASLPHWPAGEPLPSGGMAMVGSKYTLLTGARPDSPRLLPEAVWQDFRKSPPEPTIPRVKGGPFREWIAAIKGEGPAPGSSFDYSAALTEMSLVGVLAQRTGERIEFDAEAMRVTNRSDSDVLIKNPVRPGWNYGADLWPAAPKPAAPRRWQGPAGRRV